MEFHFFYCNTIFSVSGTFFVWEIFWQECIYISFKKIPQTMCFSDGCQEIKQFLTTAHGLNNERLDILPPTDLGICFQIAGGGLTED